MNSIDSPINLAIIFDQEVQSGGGFQQGLNAAILALKINPDLAKINIFHTKKKIGKELLKYDINSKFINLSVLAKIYIYIKTTERFRILYKFLKIIFDFYFLESFLKKEKIDLVYFISPSRYAMDLDKLNFFYTVWDICHIDQLEFPKLKKKMSLTIEN